MFVVFAVVVLFVAAQQNVGKCVSISTIALVGSTEEETMGVVPRTTQRGCVCGAWVACCTLML